MEQALLARADDLQQMGCHLLDRLHFTDLWEAAGGKPVLIGSLKTGLMMEPNIDFNILMPTEKPDILSCFSVLQILSKATETFDDAHFFVNSHLTQADPYLYIGFGFKYEGEEWDFDNEIFGCSHPRTQTASQTTEALLQVMDPDTRLTILRIKDERLHTRGGSWRGSSQPGSLDIYRAVFDGGAQTLAECETWLAGHPGREDYFWLPSRSNPARP